jgi:hypothetical protein
MNCSFNSLANHAHQTLVVSIECDDALILFHRAYPTGWIFEKPQLGGTKTRQTRVDR